MGLSGKFWDFGDIDLEKCPALAGILSVNFLWGRDALNVITTPNVSTQPGPTPESAWNREEK